MKKIFPILLLISLLFSCGENVSDKSPYPYAHLYEDLPFDMPRVEIPTFPDNQVSVADHGGKPDGITLNTQAFEDAMQALSDMGGGTLTVPKGIWFTGPIVFRSNINMHLEKGALILFSPDKDLYPLVRTVL
jgi:polygalacturonase